MIFSHCTHIIIRTVFTEMILFLTRKMMATRQQSIKRGLGLRAAWQGAVRALIPHQAPLKWCPPSLHTVTSHPTTLHLKQWEQQAHFKLCPQPCPGTRSPLEWQPGANSRSRGLQEHLRPTCFIGILPDRDILYILFTCVGSQLSQFEPNESKPPTKERDPSA